MFSLKKLIYSVNLPNWHYRVQAPNVNFKDVKRILKKTGTCWIIDAPPELIIGLIDNDRWILRNKIVWLDSTIYFLVKSRKYYFKTQYEPHNPKHLARYKYPVGGGNKSGQGAFDYTKKRMIKPNPKGRIKRSVWFNMNIGDVIKLIVSAGCPLDGKYLVALRYLEDYSGREYIK
jgi:hypothetical protein